MQLYQIIEVNEPQQYLLLNAWVIERWTDHMLDWDPANFDNVSEIMIPHYKLWLPDTTLYNSLTMNHAETKRLMNAQLTTTNGSGANVKLLYPTMYKFSCNLDLRAFPFDVQQCKMILGSYREEIKYACCPNNYTLLHYIIHLRRKPLYYVINLIIPTGIITLISIVGFFTSSSINDIREEKITLGITTLLSMSILILMVSDKMPSTSSFIPLIGWFYTFMIMLISCATLASSFVIYIQKQGLIGNPPEKSTMKWARRVGKIFRVEMPLIMKEAYAAKARDPLRRPPTLKISRDESDHLVIPPLSLDSSSPTLLDLQNLSLFPTQRLVSPRSADRRNLAQLEFDWLAAVVERLLLLLFLLLFALMSVGINLIGWYYWYIAGFQYDFYLVDTTIS
ncbi:unnamed protein product, partial [Mesorhabditis belari]|uniref:Uncharacterized protein n=1 Tax=Mesorhabditis belari TaxID=2138241 RepID=A0AAF3FQA1_9BILA